MSEHSASEQRQPRFRALVAQTTKLQVGASSGILMDEMLNEKATKAMINGLGRFAVLQTPTSCHRPESKAESASRVADGQEWKSQGSNPGDLEKDVLVLSAVNLPVGHINGSHSSSLKSRSTR